MVNVKQDEAKLKALTTLEYLGGANKIKAMVNGKHFSYDKNGGIQFWFEGNKKMNVVKFDLMPNDLYQVTFYKFNRRTFELKEVEQIKDVYADQLKEIFERTTGLYLSL